MDFKESCGWQIFLFYFAESRAKVLSHCLWSLKKFQRITEGSWTCKRKKTSYKRNVHRRVKLLRLGECFVSYASFWLGANDHSIQKIEDSFCKLFGRTALQTLCNISSSAHLPTNGQHICGNDVMFSSFFSFSRIYWCQKIISLEGSSWLVYLKS